MLLAHFHPIPRSDKKTWSFLTVAHHALWMLPTKRSAVTVPQEIRGTTTHSRGAERAGAKAEATRTSIAIKAREACIV